MVNLIFFPLPFFYCLFFIAVFFGGTKFRAIFEPYFNRLYIPMPVVKNGGGFRGNFFEIFSLKSVNSGFSLNRCAGRVTNTMCVLQYTDTLLWSWAFQWANFGGP
jgi:hypothetical protein